MPRIGCTRFRFAPILSLALVAAALGCREDAQSPNAPEPGPAFAGQASQCAVVPPGERGLVHTCGVTTGNLAYCWGTTSGRTRRRHDHRTSDAVAVAGGLRFRQVSAGIVKPAA